METPSLKARKSQEAEEARLRWQEAKEMYARAEAKLYLTLKAEDGDLKQGDIKALINDNSTLHEGRMELIMFEANYRKLEQEVLALDDHITSAKMLGRLKMAEMTNLGGV